jgi:hypothetical protein
MDERDLPTGVESSRPIVLLRKRGKLAGHVVEGLRAVECPCGASSCERQRAGEQPAQRLNAFEKAGASANPKLEATACTLRVGSNSNACATSSSTPSRTDLNVVPSSSRDCRLSWPAC